LTTVRRLWLRFVTWKCFDPTTERILTAIVALCSGSLDHHHQRCVAGARYSVGTGHRGSDTPGQEGWSILTSNRQLPHIDDIQLMFAGDMCYVLALYWSKASIGLFFRRLSATTEKTLFADILVYSCAALGIVSTLLIGLRQQVIEPWLEGPALGQSTVSDTQQDDKFYSAANIDVATTLDCG
jgi:hypothetical protein